MKNEKLQSWALTAEIIGAFAIVISLGFIAYELNQSTAQAELNANALEISTYQGLINSIIDLNTVLATDPELSPAIIKAITSSEDLSREELLRLNSYYINVIRHGDMAFFQYERGAIDEDRLDSVLRIVFGTLNNPVAMNRYELAKSGLSSSYVEYLDSFLSRLREEYN